MSTGSMRRELKRHAVLRRGHQIAATIPLIYAILPPREKQ